MMLKKTVMNMRNRTVRLERQGDYWTKDEKEQLRTMFKEGIGITEMALTLQRTEPAIIQQIEKEDLYHRKDAPTRHRKSRKADRRLYPVCTGDPECCPFARRDLPESEDE